MDFVEYIMSICEEEEVPGSDELQRLNDKSLTDISYDISHLLGTKNGTEPLP